MPEGRCKLPKRPITPAYVMFYLLFLPDFWRILIGVIVAAVVFPIVVKPDMGPGAKAMIFIMLATIGYAVSSKPARWITSQLKRLIIDKGHRQ